MASDRVLLPKNVVPKKYYLTLEPNLEVFTFTGTQKIEIDIVQNSKSMVLNAKDLKVEKCVVKTKEGASIGTKISYDKENEYVIFDLESEAKQGNAVLEMNFEGELNDKMVGFYRSAYKVQNSEGKEETRYMATTQFEPTDARRCFPCWDEPAVKACFEVSLIVPQNRVALSNMNIVSESSLSNEKKLVKYASTPIMSTYLLAFVVGEFEFIEGHTKDGLPIRVYTAIGKTNQGKFALDVALKVIPLYEQYFGEKYPLPKLDLIAIPDFAAGAMENWGLVTYRETALLVDPENSSAHSKQWVALVVSHECFSRGTEVLMNNGQVKRIEDIQIGDFVLGPDSNPRRVVNTVKGIDEMYRIFEHTECEGKNYASTEYVCNSRHLLQLTTPCTPCLYTKIIGGDVHYVVRYLSLEEQVVPETKKSIKMVVPCEKSWSCMKWGNTAESYATEFNQVLMNKNIDWTIPAQDYKYVKECVKKVTFQKLAPILVEQQILRKSMEALGLDSSLVNEAAYLLGSWIGTGKAKDLVLPLDTRDQDLIERVQKFGKALGLNMSNVQSQSNDSLKNENTHVSFNSVDTNKIRNTFWDLVESFEMRKEDVEGFPSFIRSDEISIREWFLAGLIDSDIYFQKDRDFAELHTTSESTMENIVALTKSLGICTSVSCEDRSDNVAMFKIKLSQCSAVQNILSKCSIESKQMEAPEHVEYEQQKFYFNVEKCQSLEMLDSSKINIENFEYYGITLSEDSDQLFLLSNNAVVHNCAHMWFGNLVTMEWWEHLWLNEGFATWVEYFAVDQLFPEWKIFEQFVHDDFSRAQSLDALLSSHPIEVDVKKAQEVDEIFDAISYSKGCAVIRMLVDWLGLETFRQGLLIYLNRHKYGNASSDDLWKALSESSKKDVKTMMTTWTRQTGYPVIVVKEEKKTNGKRILTLEQQRYLDVGKSDDDTLWHIPLSYITSSNPETVERMLMKEKKLTLEIDDSVKWIKFNYSQTGFYRVLYTDEQYTQLKTAVTELSLPAIDRLGVQEDACALSKSGYMSTKNALEILNSYSSENNYTVWTSMSSNLATIYDLIKDKEKITQKFDKFAVSIFKNQGNILGWDPKPNESHLQSLLRTLIISNLAKYKDQETIDVAKDRFSQFLKDSKVVVPDLRTCMYATVIRNGGEKEYEQVLDLFRKAELNEEKNRCLRALGATQNEKLLKQTFEFSMSKEVRSQDMFYVIMTASSNVKGREMGWNFFVEHLQEIKNKFEGGFIIGRIIKIIVSGFVTEEKANEIEQFFSKNPIPSAQRSIAQSLESIRLDAAWLKRDEADIENWLDQHQ